jgi:hypothetical protein
MKIKYSDFTQQTRSKTVPYFISRPYFRNSKSCYIKRRYEFRTTVRISLSSKYRRKKTLAVQLKFLLILSNIRSTMVKYFVFCFLFFIKKFTFAVNMKKMSHLKQYEAIKYNKDLQLMLFQFFLRIFIINS